MPSWKRPMDIPPKMLAAAQKCLAARKLTRSSEVCDRNTRRPPL